MAAIVIFVFLGVFGVVALVAIGVGSGASQQAKQVHATLDSALATDIQEDRSQILDLRKTEHLSSIPWLNPDCCQRSNWGRASRRCSIRPILNGLPAA